MYSWILIGRDLVGGAARRISSTFAGRRFLGVQHRLLLQQSGYETSLHCPWHISREPRVDCYLVAFSRFHPDHRIRKGLISAHNLFSELFIANPVRYVPDTPHECARRFEVVRGHLVWFSEQSFRVHQSHMRPIGQMIDTLTDQLVLPQLIGGEEDFRIDGKGAATGMSALMSQSEIQNMTYA